MINPQRHLSRNMGAWLRSIGIVFVFGNILFVAAIIGIYLNRDVVSSFFNPSQAALSASFPITPDSLQISRAKPGRLLREVEHKIAHLQIVADSMAFEILSRQALTANLDSEISQLQLRLAEERATRVRHMARIMASSSAETIGKMCEGIDDVMLAKIVTTSNNREAAKILAALEPERAAQVMRELTKGQALH